ncbi:hypothetical protein SBO82_03510 [Alcaligenes nematophilus]|uniref:hypothetical protein n=1 Tax=Alcaligenes nematophilus TaxID=2994643 RepID=UPI0024675139|nr:hypothetical protein [Alcaligenes nematophilus]MDH4866033.1 hypothetical protein [Bacillus cereus]MDY7127332.1 hypothetical protein [Alcaligenes nematophilus]
MIGVIIGQVWPYVLGLLALAAGWFTAKSVGRQEGRSEAVQKQYQADIAAVEVGRDAAETIERLDDDAVRDRARQRMRDTEGR